MSFSFCTRLRVLIAVTKVLRLEVAVLGDEANSSEHPSSEVLIEDIFH